MERRDFLKAAALTGAGVSVSKASGAESGRQGRPNVVLFHIDDMGWKDLGCYGSRYYETPHVDTLARDGMKFTDAYASAAICSPTRAALLTGRYPARLGITDWIRARFQGGEIPEDGKQPSGYPADTDRKLLCPRNHMWLPLDEVTIAEALQSAGYASCHIGKWHLGADPWYPTEQGFDYNIGGCDFGQPPSYFDPYSREGQGRLPTLEPRKKGEYLTDREADEAVRFIDNHRDQPFFLHMAHYGVHTPIQARDELVEKYRNKPTYGQKNPKYAAMVESIDHAVGQILGKIDELGLRENTLVIFTSDNGGLSRVTNNDPLRRGKGWPYEGGIRVPLLVRYPGVVPEGRVSSEPACSVDYLPTILDAAGLPLPKDREIDGASLMPHMQSGGSESLDREAIFWHFPHYRGRQIPPYSIVRAGRWKLIKWWPGPTYELYDLEKDPGEENDLSEDRPEQVYELHQRLLTWLDETRASLPVRNPRYGG